MKLRILWLFCSVLLSSCAKPPAAQFSYYQPDNAWDAALLFTLDCSDYIDSSTCFEKRAELGSIFKSTFPAMKAHDATKYHCLGYKKVEVISGDFIDYVEKHSLEYSSTVDSWMLWFNDYRCEK